MFIFRLPFATTGLKAGKSYIKDTENNFRLDLKVSELARLSKFLYHACCWSLP